MAEIIGIGYQGRTDDEVIAALRQAGVSVVVDVRANPYSRGRKSLLNRNRAEHALGEHGIQYIWLGDRLGNLRDPSGQRTLPGFKEYMETPTYQEGIQSLCQILEKVQGTVALFCFERQDRDCHRHLILEDLQRRMFGRA